MRERILVVCNHPGGAHVVNAVLDYFFEHHPEFEFDLCLTLHSKKVFRSLNKKINQTIYNEEISFTDTKNILWKDYKCVLLGTSIAGNIEKIFIQQARNNNITTFSILDHWCNYEDRFELEVGTLDALPDMLFVPDNLASLDLQEIGVDRSYIYISGNPAFDKIKKIKEEFSDMYKKHIFDSLSIDYKSSICTFVSEPVSVDHFSKKLNYSEFTILENICNVLEQVDIKNRLSLIIKLHPREDKDKFDEIISKYKALNIKISPSSVDRYHLVQSSKFVLGIDSIMLLESTLLEVPTYSVQIGYQDESFIGIRLGMVNVIFDKLELLKLFENKNKFENKETLFDYGIASKTISQKILQEVF